MLQVTEGQTTQGTESFFLKVLREDERKYDYNYHYTIKIEFCKGNISKWSKAQHYFTNYPIYSSDEEVIISKLIRTGLEAGVRNFNRSNISDRKLSIVSISKDKLAVQFLLSCSSEQSTDDIAYKLFILSIRLFNLRQFNKLSFSSSGSGLLKDFKVLINLIPEEFFEIKPGVLYGL
jgi:hypothetical protein